MDAKQVPLRELLASVPADARLVIYDADGKGTRFIPVGRLCQEAAAALAEPVQEPVAWGVFDGPNLHDVNFTEEEAHEMVRLKGDGSVVKLLYTAPPQRKPLSEEELSKIIDAEIGFNSCAGWEEDFARAIERAHGIT